MDAKVPLPAASRVYVLLEGASEETFFRAAAPVFNTTFDHLLDAFVDCHGWTGVEESLSELSARDESAAALPLLDGDVYYSDAKPDPFTAQTHRNTVWLHPDFEGSFDSWMLAEALSDWESEDPGMFLVGGAPTEVINDVRNSAVATPLHAALKAHFMGSFVSEGGDPGAFSFPDKVELAGRLADVCIRWRLFSDQIRSVLEKALVIATGNLVLPAGSKDALPGDWISHGKLQLNRNACEELTLSGKLLVVSTRQLWSVDLGAQEAHQLDGLEVLDSAGWSSQTDELVARYHSDSDSGIMICQGDGTAPRWLNARSSYMCWVQPRQIYATVIGPDGSGRISSLRASDGAPRVVLDETGWKLRSATPRDRLLLYASVGNRFQIIRGSDGVSEWIYEAPLGATGDADVTPDGSLVAWVSTGDQAIQVTAIGSNQQWVLLPASIDSQVAQPCWSPNSQVIAFLWSRWRIAGSEEPWTVWVLDPAGRRALPLLMGDFNKGSLWSQAWSS